jgi:hypothetical protein
LTVLVPAPEEPVTAITGCRVDISVSPLRHLKKRLATGKKE